VARPLGPTHTICILSRDDKRANLGMFLITPKKDKQRQAVSYDTSPKTKVIVIATQ